MDQTIKSFDSLIRKLVPVSGLTQACQNELLEQAEVLALKAGDIAFRQGEQDGYTFYLLDGELELDNDGRVVKRMAAGEEDAKHPLAQIQPRQLTAEASKPATLMRVDRALLDRLLTMDDPAANSEVEVSEVESDGGVDWMTRMLRSELFQRIPPANIQRVFSVMESVAFTKGENVVEQDSVGDYYYVIQQGRCAVTRKTSASDRPIKLAELSDGDSFGEEALVSDAKRNATVTMLTDGGLMRLTKQDFVELIKNPSLTSVDFGEAKALAEKGTIWLDVRFPEENKASAVPGSLNIPLNMLRVQKSKLDAEKGYIVYCDTGARSSAGAFLLAQHGFDVHHLDGGLMQSPMEIVQAKPSAPKTKHKATAPNRDTAKPVKREIKPEVPSASAEADIRASVLTADIVKADTKMEEAMQLKAKVEAARQAAAKQIDEERAQLKKQAVQADAALKEAKRQRLALEKERRTAQQESARQRAVEQERLNAIKKKADIHLQEEKSKLERQYAEFAEELAKLRKLKEDTEAKLTQERAAVKREATVAKDQMKKAQQVLADADDAERKLRAETEAKIRQERQQLEAEFARTAAELSVAQQAREVAERARRKAAEDSERMVAEHKAALQNTRTVEEARLRAEREQLEQEANHLRVSLEEARQAKTAAEARIAKMKKPTSSTSAKIAKEIESVVADVNLTTARFEAAEVALSEVEAARSAKAVQQTQAREELKVLRAQMDAEIGQWREDNPNMEVDDSAHRDAREERRKLNKVRSKADANLVDEIAAQIGDD